MHPCEQGAADTLTLRVGLDVEMLEQPIRQARHSRRPALPLGNPDRAARQHAGGDPGAGVRLAVELREERHRDPPCQLVDAGDHVGVRRSGAADSEVLDAHVYIVTRACLFRHGPSHTCRGSDPMGQTPEEEQGPGRRTTASWRSDFFTAGASGGCCGPGRAASWSTPGRSAGARGFSASSSGPAGRPSGQADAAGAVDELLLEAGALTRDLT